VSCWGSVEFSLATVTSEASVAAGIPWRSPLGLLTFFFSKKPSSAFPLSDFVFPPEGVCNGLAYAYRRNSICTVNFLDWTTFTTDDRQLQILKIHDPRLHKPLTLVNLYVRGGSAADSCQWDLLRDLSDTLENHIVVGYFNAGHFSWDSAGVNPTGRGLATCIFSTQVNPPGLQNVQATLTLALTLPSTAVISIAG